MKETQEAKNQVKGSGEMQETQQAGYNTTRHSKQFTDLTQLAFLLIYYLSGLKLLFKPLLKTSHRTCLTRHALLPCSLASSCLLLSCLSSRVPFFFLSSGGEARSLERIVNLEGKGLLIILSVGTVIGISIYT